jgi:hypothetical protein
MRDLSNGKANTVQYCRGLLTLANPTDNRITTLVLPTVYTVDITILTQSIPLGSSSFQQLPAANASASPSVRNSNHAKELHRLQSRSIAGCVAPVLRCLQFRSILFQDLSEEILEEAAQATL